MYHFAAWTSNVIIFNLSELLKIHFQFLIFLFICFYILFCLYFILHILYICCFSFYISFISSVMMHLVLQCEMQCDDIVTTDIMHNHPCCCGEGACPPCPVPCVIGCSCRAVSVTCMWVKKTENRTKVIDKIKS